MDRQFSEILYALDVTKAGIFCNYPSVRPFFLCDVSETFKHSDRLKCNQSYSRCKSLNAILKY